MVIFLTPYVLILFHFLGLGALNVASERLMDTAIGSALAGLGSYFLFPQWESGQLRKYMADVLKANIHYLQKMKDLFSGNKIPTLDYKLVRKELFVSTANLSAALQRMLSEPKSKQRHRKEIYEFVVLNHVLSSNVASLTAEMINQQNEKTYFEFIKPVNSSITVLEKSLQKIDNNFSIQKQSDHQNFSTPFNKTADEQLNEQMNFIYKISGDIGKITNLITT
jgi:uncharacterized membrane protein YccC